ncbi:MAG: hypothetical protein ABSC51_04060 [Gaiellaceae bacterium]|jgi:hypothetical protein
MKRSTRRKRLAIGLGAGLIAVFSILVSAWAFGLILHDTSEAASIRQALRDFRAGQHRNDGLNGVYLYATKGQESIDALGGASHTYPATTSITVIEVPCGLQLHWAALKGRSTTWVFCSTPAGTELRVSDERHSFFGQHDHTTYTCSHRLLLPKKPVIGSVTAFRCSSQRGWEIGTVNILGWATLDIDGDQVRALHVSTPLSIHGGDGGNETIDWWLAENTALPLRIALQSRTSRSIFIGTVHYRENFSLSLLSLKPKR